tara:strand:- start:323 stop:736 length:414 start_codon:yes stop_codon:yes gene_type:complete
MRFFIYLLPALLLMTSCEESNLPKKINPFIGTWILESDTENRFEKGILVYTEGGYMIAALNRPDMPAVGYSGKYEINFDEKFVTHYRDFYPNINLAKDTVMPPYVRNYELKNYNKTIVLKPREGKIELTWNKVENYN